MLEHIYDFWTVGIIAALAGIRQSRPMPKLQKNKKQISQLGRHFDGTGAVPIVSFCINLARVPYGSAVRSQDDDVTPDRWAPIGPLCESGTGRPQAGVLPEGQFPERDERVRTADRIQRLADNSSPHLRGRRFVPAAVPERSGRESNPASA